MEIVWKCVNIWCGDVLIGVTYPDPVEVFCTIPDPPNCHIMQTTVFLCVCSPLVFCCCKFPCLGSLAGVMSNTNHEMMPLTRYMSNTYIKCNTSTAITRQFNCNTSNMDN